MSTDNEAEAQEPTDHEKRVALNAKKLNLIAQMGVDPNSIILSTRLEAIIEHVLPALVGGYENPQRDEFDKKFEEALSQRLDEVAAQIRQQLTVAQLEVPKLEVVK